MQVACCPCARPVPSTSSASSTSSSSNRCGALNAESNGAYGGPGVGGPISMGMPSSLPSEGKGEKGSKPVDRSKGLWTRCDKCGVILYIKHLKEHHHICFGCNYHLKMSSQERIDHLVDPGGVSGLVCLCVGG
jgi:acetyl-CoA carboxylase carboxyl transferase subunit beta